MSVINKRYVTPRENLIYGVANGGQCMSYTFLTSYISYFFVNVFNIDAKIVASMLFITGIWDAINDPLMGSIIDKTRTRHGKLKPYLLGVPIPLAITTIMLFAGPLVVSTGGQRAWQKIVYMFVTYFLWEFFYTIGDVPFWGLSAAISPNPEDRTRAITSARFISNIVGALPGIIIPILIDLVNSSIINTNLKMIFFGYAVFSGVFGMGLFSLSGIFVKERVVQATQEPSFGECLKGLIYNKPLRTIILKDVLSSLGGIGGPFSTYYYVDVLGSASAALVVGIPGAVTGLGGYSLIPFFKKRFNNKQIVIGARIYEVIIGISKYLLGIGKYTRPGFMIPMMAVESGFSGVLAGVNSVVPTEMIGETVDYSEWTTGQRSEGISFAVLTFVGKFGGAMSRALSVWLLPFIGYKTSDHSAILPQGVSTKAMIWALFTIIPALLKLFGLVPMFFYDLVGEKRNTMLKELDERRKERARQEEEAAKQAEQGNN